MIIKYCLNTYEYIYKLIYCYSYIYTDIDKDIDIVKLQLSSNIKQE